MSHPVDPYFYAWTRDADRLDAFVAALAALIEPGGKGSVSISTAGVRGEFEQADVSLEEMIAVLHSRFTSSSEANIYIPHRLPSRGGLANIQLRCFGPGWSGGRFPHDCLVAASGYTYLHPGVIHVGATLGATTTQVAAAVLSIMVQEDMEDILVRLCAPDDRNRIPTGGHTGTDAGSWGAPIELAATFNADGNVARDIALSWIYLRDGDRVGYIAGSSMETLMKRVEGAPRGSTVGVATRLRRVREHEGADYVVAAHDVAMRGTHVGAIRRVPRERLPGDVDLTREQVLQVLETPPGVLLDALDAAAVPDDEWRAVEPLAREAIEAHKQGSPTIEVDAMTDKQQRFLELHAPYHVRRLPNGGVLLATHPCRTLWQLWADALLLLGIRT
ncbi:hypothetical protein [Polyangium fumosum]|uniref:Uncharacterized protein n=1 Tax=Polyangium fumosum TaxID=889272 RepID=A0A4U1J5L5_9BACT|nr:hypothetical protein [Polyangium fumosum]TKD01799.1 hypothetical protein E8A74_29870 [Polyangium fumosum]